MGTFTAAVGLDRWSKSEEMDTIDTNRTARTMNITGVNFKADKQLIKDTACKCSLSRGGKRYLHRSPYTKEQRWQKAVEYLSDPAHPVMRLDDYVRLTGVPRSVASRELREYYDLPDSQISTFGRGTSKVYVKRNMEQKKTDMKKKIILYLVTALTIVGCSSQEKKTSQQEQNVPKQEQNVSHQEQKALKQIEATTSTDKSSTNGKVTYLTTADFKQKVMDYETHPQEWVFAGHRPVVIDFYATWCRPCKMMSPIVEQLAKQNAGKVDFYKVDIDQEPELASVFGIQSIPTFLFIPMKGKPTAQMGMMEKEEMEKVIKGIQQ